LTGITIFGTLFVELDGNDCHVVLPREVAMVPIHTITRNGEIWRKILNSVADKYNCGVRFTISKGRLGYEGDQACAMEIIKETMALFGAGASAN
jgi:hypothetical protein